MIHHPYVQAAIDGEIASLECATEGERNDKLYKSAAAIASFRLPEADVFRLLAPIAKRIGLDDREIASTIKSAVTNGHAKPRQLPAAAISCTGGAKVAPRRDKSAFLPGGDAGPPRGGDEARRHVYPRNGVPDRIKIKRSSGGFVNWYRVVRDGVSGWQARKPQDYTPCPYVGQVNPFDDELAEDEIYWPEGEKDCDTLGRLNKAAFTFGGTGDGLPAGIDQFLRGRDIVILADNDVGGRKHAIRKAELAQPIANSVKLVEFPELPDGGDVSDFLQTASVENLEERVAATSLWVGGAAVTATPARAPSWRDAAISASDLNAKIFEPIQYILPGYIPEGVTIFAGKPKVGKSWLLYDVCLGCAADRFVLGTIKPAQGDVLYLALEDSQRRLKGRLRKLLADQLPPSRLMLATHWRRADDGGIDDIAEWCNSVSKPVLIVIDTLEKFRPVPKHGMPAYTTDYAAIAALHKLAHERGIAIVVIHHVRKMEADDPFDMVSGTNGLTGAADTILVLMREAGGVTLHARGRDIEEQDTACTFNRETCRWTLIGNASQVRGSSERAAILEVLHAADENGMSVRDIMSATERRDRNAVDVLLFKMGRDGEVARVKRGVYADAGKIGKKERNETQVTEFNGNSVDLTDLTAVGRKS